MKTKMNVTSEIVTRATHGNNKRLRAAMPLLLVALLQAIQLNPHAVFAQQGNVDPRVASQEGANLKTSDAKTVIPIISLSTLPVLKLLSGGASGAINAVGPCGCREAVTQLTLQYDGASEVPVRVLDSHKRELFTGTVGSGQQFSFMGHDNQRLGAVTLRVNGRFHTKIKTSCSPPIGPGLVRGDFVVISGKSSGDAGLCPVQQSDRKNPKELTTASVGQR